MRKYYSFHISSSLTISQEHGKKAAPVFNNTFIETNASVVSDTHLVKVAVFEITLIKVFFLTVKVFSIAFLNKHHAEVFMLFPCCKYHGNVN